MKNPTLKFCRSRKELSYEKFMKEITLFIIQLLIFYLFPLFAKQIDAIGMVLFLITATFVLSALMGIISTNKIKYFYPLITAILFIPSVFIYYNESALIHSVWYFVVSVVGTAIGTVITKLFAK